MKYMWLVFLSVLTLVIVLAAAFIVDTAIDLENITLNTAAGVATILSSVLTLVIALILYRRFTGTQFLADKQTTVVMNLVEYMSDLHFHFAVLENGKIRISEGKIIDTVLTDIYLKDQSTSNNDPMSEKYNGLIYYADKDLLRSADKFMHLSTNVYLPRELAKKISYHFNSRTPWWLDSNDKNTAKKYMQVSLSSGDETGEFKSYYANYVVVDAKELSRGLVEIYEEALRWMKRNNPDIFSKLNIPKFEKP